MRQSENNFGVAGVLVEHVGRAGLDLALDDDTPQRLRLDDASLLALDFVLLVARVKGGAVQILQTGRLVGTKQRPVAVGFNATK